MAEFSAPAIWRGSSLDPSACPALYDGVACRRCLAYFIDLLAIAVLLGAAWSGLIMLGLLTFGLLWSLLPIVIWLIPIGYHALLVGGAHNATLGMRLTDLEVRTVIGGRPGLGQSLLMAVLFYATVAPTGFLILIVALLNDRRRTLHDYLSGVVVIRRSKGYLDLTPPIARA
ncbi:MAG: hypothetical protein QOK29_4170 [Rhodospirillaceae bacterium]|jgi:uncharacterized RDD family membrane protein YckC|nr:hypothetical protein [Rhodospirillaceae bacterium]